MNKKLCVYTFVIFVINLIIAIFLLMSAVFFIIKNKAVLPFVVIFIFSICFITLTCHYYKCLLWLKRDRKFNEKVIKRMHVSNFIIICITFVICISMTALLLYAAVILNTFFDLQIYFLCADILSVVYLINTSLIDKKLNCNK